MEDSAMKVHTCLSAVLLTIFLCAFFCVSRNARAATPAIPAGQSAGTRSSGPAASPDSPEEVTLPGPLRSFLRMAAISQKVSPEEVLPLLARNVVVNGFQGGAGKPTEFLILLNWYMDQARELMTFAGPGGVIQISSCAEAKPLLPILGYRMVDSWGPTPSLSKTNGEGESSRLIWGFPCRNWKIPCGAVSLSPIPSHRPECPCCLVARNGLRQRR